jgi:hypothetical protein
MSPIRKTSPTHHPNPPNPRHASTPAPGHPHLATLTPLVELPHPPTRAPAAPTTPATPVSPHPHPRAEHAPHSRPGPPGPATLPDLGSACPHPRRVSAPDPAPPSDRRAKRGERRSRKLGRCGPERSGGTHRHERGAAFLRRSEAGEQKSGASRAGDEVAQQEATLRLRLRSSPVRCVRDSGRPRCAASATPVASDPPHPRLRLPPARRRHAAPAPGHPHPHSRDPQPPQPPPRLARPPSPPQGRAPCGNRSITRLT